MSGEEGGGKKGERKVGVRKGRMGERKDGGEEGWGKKGEGGDWGKPVETRDISN